MRHVGKKVFSDYLVRQITVPYLVRVVNETLIRKNQRGKVTWILHQSVVNFLQVWSKFHAIELRIDDHKHRK